jgi:hypothetical protein
MLVKKIFIFWHFQFLSSLVVSPKKVVKRKVVAQLLVYNFFFTTFCLIINKLDKNRVFRKENFLKILHLNRGVITPQIR